MAVDAIKLSDFFRIVKKPRYVLGTTYTLSLAFFESVVLPYVDRSQLHRCLIVCDTIGYQRAMSEGPALQGAGQNYLVAPAPFKGSFHSKVWIVIGENELAILAGSGNLTQSGFIGNAELFDALFFDKDTKPSPQLLEDIVSFVSGLASMWEANTTKGSLCVETLNQIRQEIARFGSAPSTQPTVRLLHSFAQEPLFESLPDVADCSDIYAASPYFGGKTDGIELLRSRYPGARLHLYPAIHNSDELDIPLSIVKSEVNPATLAPLKLQGKANAFAHLKLYGLKSADKAWLYCTSANCTRAAWTGGNLEAGLLREVPPALLQEYFQADTQSHLPEGRLKMSGDAALTGVLKLSAEDTGSHLEIALVQSTGDTLPLHDVSIAVRTGSSLATCMKPSLFAHALSERIPWSDFSNFSRQRNMAICLEISAKASDGSPVRGLCFVDNNLLLKADPMHRSAWRGALALLDAETLPELADIAAIFSLAGNIFDGRFITRAVHVNPKPSSNAPDVEPDEDNLPVAIWPPEPVHNDLHRQIGSTGLGQLDWCRRIIQTFLNPESGSNVQLPVIADDSDDEASAGQDRAISPADRDAAEKQVQSAASRLWDHASKDYQRLLDRLQKLEPSEKNEQNVWAGSVFVFLATLAVRNAVARVTTHLGEIPSAFHLSCQFLNVMVEPRKQHPDFCCSKDMRYTRETFPPLSADLRSTFQREPSDDLALIMLSIVIQKRMIEAPNGEYPLLWPRLLKDVLPPDILLDDHAAKACCKTWRVYLRDENSSFTEDDFIRAFYALEKCWEAK